MTLYRQSLNNFTKEVDQGRSRGGGGGGGGPKIGKKKKICVKS